MLPGDLRAPTRRKKRGRKAKPAPARGPQGLPTYTRSPQRQTKPRPNINLRPPARGPQGLGAPTSSLQKARKPRPSIFKPKPEPKKAGRAGRLFPTSERTKAVQKGERQSGKRNTEAAAVLHTLLGQPKRELEGKGVLAKGLSFLAEHVDLTQPQGYKSAGIQIAGPRKGVADLPKKVTQDLFNAPAQVLPSVYVPLAGVVEAAQGRPERLKGFLKDVDQGDPIFNAGAAVVAAIEGDSKEASKRWEATKKSVSEHPGFAGLELFGLKGTVGRGAGRTARSGVLGPAAKRAGSTRRAPRAIEGIPATELREYSPDIITKAVQVEREARKRRHVASLRREATQLEDEHPQRAAELRSKANRKDPDKMSEREIKRQVTEHFAARQEIAREHKGLVAHEVSQALKGTTKAEQKALSVVAQGITRASKKDIQAYIREVENEFPKLDRAGQAANKKLRHQLQQAVDGKMNEANLKAAADRYQALSEPHQRKLVAAGLLEGAQQERAALIPYAVRNMGARFDERADALLLDGHRLKSAEILEHMDAHNVARPSFLTQAPNARGGGIFNIRPERGQALRARRRTGAATIEGTFDPHPETLLENATRARGLVDAVDGWKGFIQGFAVRSDKDPMQPHMSSTYNEAIKVRDNLNARDDAVPMAVIRAHPFGAAKKQIDDMLDADDPHQIDGFRTLMDEALQGKGDSGPWAIVPQAAVAELQGHLNAMGPGANLKAWAVFNNLWRQTVLATSGLSWPLGNILEGTFRTAIARAGPRSYVTGLRTLAELKRMDPEAAEQAIARIVTGGHGSFAHKAKRYANAQQFEGTAYAGLASAMAKLRRTTGPKQVADGWNAYTRFVFGVMNGKLESQFQVAMLGKALRDSPLMDGQTLKLSKKAITQAAEGLKGTPEQIQLGRKVDRMFGQYGKFSPGKRTAIAYYTPFVAWTLNATRFVLDVLPRDHPTTLALIASAEQATEEWRKENGLDLFMAGRVPGWLQGTIPNSGGGKQNISRFTPFGAFGDIADTYASAALPQVMGILDIGRHGIDWKGSVVRNSKGEPASVTEKGVAAVDSVINSTVPFLALGRRIAEQGPETLIKPLLPIKTKEESKPSGKDDFDKMFDAQGGGPSVSDDEFDAMMKAQG